MERPVPIPADGAQLEGVLALPQGATGIVAFAHGSGSSRLSPRNNFVAGVLRDSGIATLLMDLLTRAEDTDYATRFDIGLLTERLLAATRWLENNPETSPLRIGYFGASTGAAAALQAAAREPGIGAVVSRGGRPDLAGVEALRRVSAPTLFIVGSRDRGVIELNQEAYALLTCPKELILIPGATHLFEEPGTLEQVAEHAARWFGQYLQ